MSLRPLSDLDVRRRFGDPLAFVNDDGTVDAAWESLILGSASFPEPLPLSWDPAKRVKHFRCHRLLARIFTEAFKDLHATYPDAWATIGDFGGCYAWRPQRGSKTLSRHSWGIAIDLDVRDNPMGRAGHVHSRLLEMMEAHGFAWGGDFSGTRVDPMHWEFADPARIP